MLAAVVHGLGHCYHNLTPTFAQLIAWGSIMGRDRPEWLEHIKTPPIMQWRAVEDHEAAQHH